ncbi:hypothetical protein XELAEV_18039927mg [Xenopus laevis]|uniref:Uncharacterized protein n=1 Tax=Xenopus laevis TaxID=8355 RepID=A0A974C8Q3_XENLA|nr:hypothetical protein XELAEV_18039927mg [Xenopus laevis]
MYGEKIPAFKLLINMMQQYEFLFHQLHASKLVFLKRILALPLKINRSVSNCYALTLRKYVSFCVEVCSDIPINT